MSRLFAFDTETTGLKPIEGDRLIEVAAVEITRDPNPATFHRLINPAGREISEEAFRVHGIRDADLLDKPTWDIVLPELLDFLGDDATLVIHNAPFDLEFVRSDSDQVDMVWPEFPIIDTLREAIKAFPNARHSLDALCNRFKIDLSRRSKHSALIDTTLLAEVYLAWFGQQGFDLSIARSAKVVDVAAALGAMNAKPVPIPTGIIRPATQLWGSYDEELSKIGL